MFDVAIEEVPHQLDAVADAKDRHAELEDRRIRMRRLAGIDALRTAG